MKDEYDFSEGKRGAVVPIPPGKTRVTIRLDDDVLEWFRAQVEAAGRGNYQTLINRVLHDYVARARELHGSLEHSLREELAPYHADARPTISLPLTLEQLFQFQDFAASYNLQQLEAVRRRYQFVRAGVNLGAAALGAISFPMPKQHVIRVLGVDALTSVIACVRVGLWGNLPESWAILRAGIETAIILAAVVKKQEYQAALYELSHRLNRFSFDNAVIELGDRKKKLLALHGDLSGVGSHASGLRAGLSSYSAAGDQYDRLGAALDPKAASAALTYSLDACLQVLLALKEAFDQDKLPFPNEPELEALISGFEAARKD